MPIEPRQIAILSTADLGMFSRVQQLCMLRFSELLAGSIAIG